MLTETNCSAIMLTGWRLSRALVSDIFLGNLEANVPSRSVMLAFASFLSEEVDVL
jgi:hypothetical protein